MPAIFSATTARAPSAQRSSRAVVSETRAILRRIRAEEITLALWERPLPEAVAAFAQNLATTQGALALDTTAAPEALLARLSRAHPFTHAAESAAAHWLLEDIAALAADFAALVACAEVRVRLTKVADDGCAAFHVDTLAVRMLCTYAGRGTQWADEPDVRRTELGPCNRTLAETNAAIVPDPARIRIMPTGAVAIFKGRLWPGAEQHGLVHRSHPVCCGEHARLRLCLDPAGHGC